MEESQVRDGVIDLSQPLSRGIEIRTEDIDEENHIIPMCISSNSVDSYKSIILQDGIDHEERYARNSIYCWNHPLHEFFTSPGPERLLARAVKGPIIEGKDESAKTSYHYKFAVEENPMARLVFNLIKGKYLRASSVGIFARSIVYARSEEEELETLPEFARLALLKGKARFVIDKSVLFEASCTFVGANLDALREMAVRSGVNPNSHMFLNLQSKVANLIERAEAAVTKLERMAMTPEERDFEDFRREIEANPEMLAVLG